MDELRQISQDELDEILIEHKKWLNTGGKEGKCADLSHCNLRELDFHGADVSRANFSHADISDARLGGTNLTKADFSFAVCNHTWFDNHAVAQKTNFYKAQFCRAAAFDSDFSRANFDGADLTRASFGNSQLVAATLTNTTLYHTDFGYANLTDANLSNAFMLYSDMYGATVTNARLYKCNMAFALNEDMMVGLDWSSSFAPDKESVVENLRRQSKQLKIKNSRAVATDRTIIRNNTPTL